MAKIIFTLSAAAFTALIIYLAIMDVPVQTKTVTVELPAQDFLSDVE